MDRLVCVGTDGAFEAGEEGNGVRCEEYWLITERERRACLRSDVFTGFSSLKCCSRRAHVFQISDAISATIVYLFTSCIIECLLQSKWEETD